TGIKIDDTDALYLDGQRIVPVSQSGTGAGRTIEYRKAIDDQSRITQVGATFATSFFKVETKGGVTILFNGTHGSRVKLSDGTVLLLAESAIIDSAGNFIEYHYDTNDKGNYDIQSIKYTGHGVLDPSGNIVADQAPFASIDFTYERVRALTT